jgi:hypothetical protein
MEIFTIAGSKGGKASAAALTPAERRAKALKAVAAREAKRKTKCEAEDEVRLALR